MAEETTLLLDLPPSKWPEWFEQNGGKAFHGRIAARWVFKRGVSDWNQMSDLPTALREKLAVEHPLLQSKLEASSNSTDGACKVLLRFPDGGAVEAVSMPGTQGLTICLSTQIGCPVRCPFCASGASGLERNLRPSEILEQVLWLWREHGEFGRIVVMGMGDAGFNLTPVLKALDSLIDKKGGGLSPRRITLSTVAPPRALATIAEWGRPINVAISLHAADDKLRQELVPGIAKRTVLETIEEAEQLFASSHREYTIEYVLLAGVNDSIEQAQRLANLLHGRRCHLNLIPYNEVEGFGFSRPTLPACEEFAAVTIKAGISTTLRRSLGRSNNAACGQLRLHQQLT